MADRQQGGLIWNMPLPRTRWAIVGFVAGVFAWSFAGGGQQNRVGEKNNVPDVEADGPVGVLDSTLHKLNQGIRDTTANVRDRITTVQNSAHNMNLGARVKERLAEERSIDDDRIEVAINDEGTVVLRGQVPDANTKAMAVDIARDTEGVLKVEDHLSVPPAARVYAVKENEQASAPESRRIR